MVLTDADFGRGYLTEGWARRFLLEVFRTYSVLFVGYSHNDVVMNYLARALPADGVAGRYALTEEEEVGDSNWKLLGITPIPFCKGKGAGPFQELYEGVRYLAERVTRGALDWQSKLAEIGNRVPPADDETAGEIEQALRDTTRFLLNVARRPEWPGWLHARGRLDTMFGSAPLNDRDRLLAWWLADHYAIEYADEVIGLVVAHNMQLNPALWWAIGCRVGRDTKKQLRDSTLFRWVTILLASTPTHADLDVLEWLAASCVKHGNIQLTLEVFLFMGNHELDIKPDSGWPSGEDEPQASRFEVRTPLRTNRYTLNEVWEKHLKPNLAAIAQPLLSGIVRRLENIHHALLAWDRADHDWDEPTRARSAIEPHRQDQNPEPIDVLIDAGRDALEWLALHQPTLLDAWMEQLVVSDAPLLRRLAIHALTVHAGKTADDRMNWLLSRVGLHALAEHHEVHRVAALAYSAASGVVRQAVIDAVLRHQLPDAEDWTAAERTARARFNWLYWLHQSDPTCDLVNAALDPIKAAYPDWKAQDYPDLTHWTRFGWVGPRSPWTVKQLVSKAPAAQIDDLLSFKGNRFDGPDRDGLCSAIQEACTQEPAWAFHLDEALSARALWDSDLWAAILRGSRDADLTLDGWKLSLTRAARLELQASHPREVADLLHGLVRDGGKPFALDLLGQANTIAFSLWQSLSRANEEGHVDDWLSRAINRPAGVVVQFWLNGLSLWLRDRPADEQALPSNYREWFTAVVQDETLVGGLGRSLLASQVAFLFSLDEAWTREHIIPLFSSPDTNKFAQAWNGFLVWGRLNPWLVESLQPGFHLALRRLDAQAPDRRRRFIEFFTALIVFHVNDPTPDLLPALFKNGSLEDRITFASQLGGFLRPMAENTRRDLWARWLYRYWKNRLQSVPLPLEGAEVRKMLEWLPHLGDQFPQGVSLAVSASPVQIAHTQLMHQMRKSDLVTRFPADTAQLLIYLCDCLPGYHAEDIGMVARRLPQLNPDLSRRLDEAMARAGVDLRPHAVGN